MIELSNTKLAARTFDEFCVGVAPPKRDGSLRSATDRWEIVLASLQASAARPPEVELLVRFWRRAGQR
jgi:hypothetical protein